MSEVKLCSEEVPGKLTEWLLAMGCPAEVVPSVENITEMCRGQYYMVWRSLMEQVDEKDVIRQKRLQVFCDDVRKCQKKNVFQEGNAKTIVPEQVSLWSRQTELRGRVGEASARVAAARRDLDLITEKVHSKLAQRELSRRQAGAGARRAWLLQRVAAELRARVDTLQETRAIADSLCAPDDDGDIQPKLDRCIASFRRQHSQPDKQSLSTSTASVASNSGDDFEEQVWSLVSSRGDALCGALLERRAAAHRALAAGTRDSPRNQRHKTTPQWVLAHSAALHCRLALEATKNRAHLAQTRRKLLATLTQLNSYLPHDSCELLVLRCERAHVAARVETLRVLLQDVRGAAGAFRAPRPAGAPGGSVAALDRAIESKKEELKRVIASLGSTERKIASAKECLTSVFSALRADGQTLTGRGIQPEFSPESTAALRQFYWGRREARAKQVDLSLDLDVSDRSLTELIDYNNPKFVDELRIYMKKFNLENNRQLVLENGSKLWIFETVRASCARLHARCLARALRAPLSAAPPRAAPAAPAAPARLAADCRALEATVARFTADANFKDIDISKQVQEENQITDRVKKRLQENILELQKASKVFSLAQENLKLWGENKARKYIANSRLVEGLSYKEYENYYLENCLTL